MTLSGPSGTRNAAANASGEYDFVAPPGQYTLTFELEGFSTQRFSIALTAGGSTTHDARLNVGALAETVSVAAESRARESAIRRGGTVGGVVGGLPEAPPPSAAPMAAYDQLRDVETSAQAAALGDLFEYRIKEPVTLRKNQSALVPIVSAEVTAEKVVLWNRGAGSGRPLRAMWLSNSTGYTLDGGSVAIIDGNAFAGEGLVEPLKAGERRLISYAAELGVLVSAKQESPAEEKQLLLRYTRQLNDHEDKLEALRKNIAQASARRDRLQAELEALIQTLSFDGGKS